MDKFFLIIGLVWIWSGVATAQWKDYIIERNDTIYISTLDPVSVTAPRKFATKEEYQRYMMYRRYAIIVYPYAMKAIQLYDEIEEETQDLKKRKAKKVINEHHKELKEEFTDQLKHLTRTQGKILIKMIEKEIDRPFYDILKDLKGGVTAGYWNTMGKIYGYKLKDQYTSGEDPILDVVLKDFDFSNHKTRKN